MKSINDRRFYYLWLQNMLGVGSNKVRDVLLHFGSAEKAYTASVAELEECGIFSRAELLRKNRTDDKKLLDILKYCDENNIRVITPDDEEYPESLGFIESLPAVLFARGLRLEKNVPYFSIVGTRKPTELGEKSAFSLAARLALSGFVIVSGGALGIDAMAHLGAMAAGRKTVVVLGCGLESDYLKANKPLRESAEKIGTLISEFPPKTPASKHTFPVRNRLISAVSCGVAVIEARQKSGALITATYAMEQGKEVFAVPGNINSPEYTGNNCLLRDGAIPLISVDDVVSVYCGRFGNKISLDNSLSPAIKAVLYRELASRNSYRREKPEVSTGSKIRLKTEIKEPEKPKEKALPFLKPDISRYNCSENAKKIILAFENFTEMSDVLSLRSKISGAEFITAVTELELKGYIKAVPVGRYRLIPH